MTATALSRYIPKFPRAVDGGKYRKVLLGDDLCEALSKRMDALYREVALEHDDRALLLDCHERVAEAYRNRTQDRLDGHTQASPRWVAALAKVERFLEAFEQRVQSSGDDI